MSGSNCIASLTTTGGNPGLQFYFSLWKPDPGFVPMAMQMIQETLRAGGVDGVERIS